MPTRGRPRDPDVDAAILAAARELVVEVGYTNVSMSAVAARAGVSKPTLYLRYPARTGLIFEAIFGQTKSRALPETGDLREDLKIAYRWAVDEFAGPAARAALPGLLADVSSNTELARQLRSAVIGPEAGRVKQRLREAQATGEIRADADLDLTIDAFIGTALARLVLLDHPIDHAYGDRLVDLLLDGVLRR